MLLEEATLANEENLRLLRAHFFQGIPLSELAQQFGMTVDAVDCRIRRLLEKTHEFAEKSEPQV